MATWMLTVHQLQKRMKFILNFSHVVLKTYLTYKLSKLKMHTKRNHFTILKLYFPICFCVSKLEYQVSLGLVSLVMLKRVPGRTR